MTLRHIRIFETVCSCGCNTTRAAEKLHMTQPAVSLAIAELETYYGVKLFDRISRRLYLSEAGKRFLAGAEDILLSFDDMEKSIRAWNHGGLLRVGGSVSIGAALMPRLVKRFSEGSPDTQLRVRIDRSDRLQEAVLQNTLDFALIEGIVHDENLTEEDFLEDSLAVLVSKDAPLPPIVTVEEFCRHPLLVREIGSGTREVFASTLSAAGIAPPEPMWESLSTAALLHAAEEGLGVAVVPKRMTDGHPGLREITIDGIRFRRKYKIVYHKHKYLTNAARAFIALCRACESNEGQFCMEE